MRTSRPKKKTERERRSMRVKEDGKRGSILGKELDRGNKSMKLFNLNHNIPSAICCVLGENSFSIDA